MKPYVINVGPIPMASENEKKKSNNNTKELHINKVSALYVLCTFS